MTLKCPRFKNITDIRKHHISIPELATIWSNPFQPPSVDHFDRMVMKGKKMEKRYHAYGWTTTGWYVKTWYCYRGENAIRIIGGRELK